ncbi:MAG: hypothetical protein QOJ74_435, partial [Ilumatobacteraceae bacterium]|nr:hypothetical protein [Ilumatobacteraceae bacterium]
SPSSVVPRLPAAPATDLPVTVSAHDGVAVAGNAVRDAVPSGTVPTILLPPPAAVVDPLMTALADLPQGPIPTVAPPSTPIVTVPPVTAPPPPSGISPPAVAPTRPTISVRLIGN